MPYPDMMIKPMREEVTRLGVTELKSVAEVDAALADANGTALVFVNSVCGCAAGMARPALARALGHKVRPSHLYTVFAGQDLDATARARSYFGEYQPSSPSVALLTDGEVDAREQRPQLDGRPPDQVANLLVQAFDQHCA